MKYIIELNACNRKALKNIATAVRNWAASAHDAEEPVTEFTEHKTKYYNNALFIYTFECGGIKMNALDAILKEYANVIGASEERPVDGFIGMTGSDLIFCTWDLNIYGDTYDED